MRKEEKKKKQQQKQQLKILVEAAVDEVFLNEEGGVIYKAFIEPFTDVIQTARAGLESSVQSIVRNARKAGMQAAAAAIPFIAPAEVTRLGADESARLKEKLGEIDAKYGEVLDRNIKALQNKDVAGIAFLLNPAVTLGAHAAAWAGGKGVGAASGAIAGNLAFLELLTAHVPGVNKIFGSLEKKFNALSQKASDAADTLVHKPVYDPGFSGAGGGGYGDDFGGDYGESFENQDDRPVLSEAPPVAGATAAATGFTTSQLNQKMGAIMQKLLARKDIQDAIKTSKVVTAAKTVSIESVIERANKIASFTSIDQFRQYAGNDFARYEDKLLSQMPKNATPESKKEFEAEQVAGLKKVYKAIYKKYLRELAQKLPAMTSEIAKAEQIIAKLG